MAGMMIPQPNKQTSMITGKAFYAICPMCTKLLSLIDGIWPVHLWDEQAQCTTSLKPHDQVG